MVEKNALYGNCIFKNSPDLSPLPILISLSPGGEGGDEGELKNMKRKNIEKCRDLRKNQTEAEKKLWTMLRNRQIEGVKFRRQFAISNYIVDFYCPELKFGVEVDGGKHYETQYLKKDVIRTRQLARHDIEIIRFSNNEVLNHIEGKSPLPSSSPRGERQIIRKYSPPGKRKILRKYSPLGRGK